MTKRLIIGAGERQKKGWIHHDVQPFDGIDIVCEFWELPNHLDEAVEEIEMTHVLEHFPMAETLDALNVVHTLLEPGGKLYIEVPNFTWHAEEILKDPLNRQIVEYAYGGQLNQWDFHYNGFTPEQLAYDLNRAGFVVDNLVTNSSIECTATRR